MRRTMLATSSTTSFSSGISYSTSATRRTWWPPSGSYCRRAWIGSRFVDRSETLHCLVPSHPLTGRARSKILEEIVRDFEAAFASSHSARDRLWTAFKFSAKEKKLQKFRESLSDAKQTLMLGLMYQRYAHSSGAESACRGAQTC